MNDGVLLKFFLFGGKCGQHGREMEMMFLQRIVRRELLSAFAMYVPSVLAFLFREPWYDGQRL